MYYCSFARFHKNLILQYVEEILFLEITFLVISKYSTPGLEITVCMPMAKKGKKKWQNNMTCQVKNKIGRRNSRKTKWRPTVA